MVKAIRIPSPAAESSAYRVNTNRSPNKSRPQSAGTSKTQFQHYSSASKSRPVSAKSRSDRPQSAKPRLVNGFKTNRSHSAKTRPTSASAGPRPGSAKFRPQTATFTPPSLDDIFRQPKQKAYGEARPETPIDRAYKSDMSAIHNLFVAKNKPREHSKKFHLQLQNMEKEIEETVKKVEEKRAMELKKEEDKGATFRQRGLAIAINRSKGATHPIRMNSTTLIRRADTVTDDDFTDAIEELTSPPRRRKLELGESYNAKKKAHYATKMHKKKAVDESSSESEKDSDTDSDFLITPSYQERVQDAAVLDQMIAAREINEQRKLRKQLEKEGRNVKGYKQTLVDKMKDSHAINRYTESMQVEKESYKSIALLCETRLQECIAHTSLVESLPDEYRTAVVCDIMLKLTPVFGRYDALVTLLVKEMIRSIYRDFDHVYRGPSTDPDMLLNMGEPYFAMHRTLHAEHTLQKKMLEHATKKSSHMENTMDRGKKAMKSVIRLWHSDKREQVFRAWKGLLRYRLVSRDYTNKLFIRAKKRIWFHGWRFRVLKKIQLAKLGGSSAKKGTTMVAKLSELLREYTDARKNTRLVSSMISCQVEMESSAELLDMFHDEESDSDDSVVEEIYEQLGTKFAENDIERSNRVTKKFQKAVDKHYKLNKEAKQKRDTSTKHLLEFMTVNKKRYEQANIMEWCYLYLQAVTSDNALLEQKVVQQNNVIQALKLKTDLRTFRKVLAKFDFNNGDEGDKKADRVKPELEKFWDSYNPYLKKNIRHGGQDQKGDSVSGGGDKQKEALRTLELMVEHLRLCCQRTGDTGENIKNYALE
ncbi:hypothetical protein TrVE_jg12061 [Triparma verrucosa]|uniref:Uncharacterized protein n=1 Tax=Triparma verrucosa TaxID=1606542 RepID=A0A9W7EWT5_9STRA|nr:hypothetical protein TrVE_jg12061 [Triparma verrucosa]